MAAARHNTGWWLRMTCFFFFAGLSCFVPLLAAHLQWLGLDLYEIGIINGIASLGSALGLILAKTWSVRCGHRSNLAVAVLLAAFCGAGLVIVPRIDGRVQDVSVVERPIAEILCRPEGSALFFRKCSDDSRCELDAVTRTEVTVSDCHYEPQSRFPGNFLDWINRFALNNPNVGGGVDFGEDEGSEPERGDLPTKVTPSPSPPLYDSDEDESSTSPLDSIFNRGSNDYDYDQNHPEITTESERRRRRRRQQQAPIDPTVGINNNNVAPNVVTLPLDEEMEVNEREELPFTTSPHICFSSHSSSTTTCHVFTGTNHLFRFNTSFYSSVTHNGQCFYSLNYDDVESQILSELRCRPNKPDYQVRCRAEGAKLRASVTRNGTDACLNRQPITGNNYHLAYWLYVVFRTVGEAAVIGSIILLYIATLSEDLNQKKPIRWWPWALAGLVLTAPLAGWIADQVGLGIAFLVGSVLLGLASFTIALSPVPPELPGQVAAIEDAIVPRPVYRIVGRDLLAVLCSDTSSLLILLLMVLMGAASSVSPTVFSWFMLELGASRMILSMTITTVILASPVILVTSRWLWRRCGHCYIFIIGLLVYSIRFLGYTMVNQTLHWLVALETLEPLCSLWMLLTAAARIQQLGVMGGCKRHWIVNSWAMIIVFHYSFGRALGGIGSTVAAHYYGQIKVFIGSALICLFTAACWFLWIHLVGGTLSCETCCRRTRRRSSVSPPVVSQPPKGVKTVPSHQEEQRRLTQ